MSDYLGNIAAKSLNVAPVVHPRPVSLFEPARGEGAVGAGHRFPEEAIGGMSEPDPGEVTTEIQSIGAQNPQAQGHQPKAIPVVDHFVPMVAPNSMKSAPPRPRHESGLGPQSLIELSETVIDKESARSPSQATRQQNKSEQHHLPSANPLPTGEPHRHRVRPFIEHIASDQPGVPVSQRDVPPTFQTTESIPVQTSPSSTIQVTIGRVEVRATTPGVSSQKHRPVPKTMSLDKYLGKRSGGRP